MGMLFARRRKNVEGITTTKNLLGLEPKKVENVKPKKEVNSVPTQPKFKV